MSQSFSKADVEDARDLLEKAGLTDYEATVLSYLLVMGESKASEIIEVSDVPSAKVYETLNELFRLGMVEKKPGRPTLYIPKAPTEIVNSMIEEKQKTLNEEIKRLNTLKHDFTDVIKPLWKQGKKEERHHPLLRIVRVGDPSERETNRLISAAEQEIRIFSKVFEYFPKVKPTLTEACNRGVTLKLILYKKAKLHEEVRQVQDRILDELRHTFPSQLKIRYARHVPLRGTIVDPETGRGAIFLVEELGVPLFLREAAVTSNPKLVKAIGHYFNLLWKRLKPSNET